MIRSPSQSLILIILSLTHLAAQDNLDKETTRRIDQLCQQKFLPFNLESAQGSRVVTSRRWISRGGKLHLWKNGQFWISRWTLPTLVAAVTPLLLITSR
jgi:hypothetical protein